MTNKSEDQRDHSQDQIPASAYFTAASQRRGCCSSDGGSGGSSCNESQEERRRNNDTEEEDLDTMGCPAVSESEAEEEGLDTIKRNTRISQEPVRPPRVIDGQPGSRLEYYNLCHPPPSDPPAIPRRKPVISHISHSANTKTEPTGTSRSTTSCATSCLAATSRSTTDTLSSMASLASRTNTMKKKKYQSRRRKGSVCNCKESGRNHIVDHLGRHHFRFYLFGQLSVRWQQ